MVYEDMLVEREDCTEHRTQDQLSREEKKKKEKKRAQLRERERERVSARLKNLAINTKRK
jgi:hypothetical protein